jgi:hypothetical protein
MRVVFSEPEEWLDELRESAAESDVECVRVSIDRITSSPDGTGASTVALFGSFMAEDLLFELLFDCGIDQVKFEQGTKTANQVKADIKAVCDELGIRLRGGRLDLGI